MLAVLDAIDIALCEGHGVYIHCWGGVGRTGTVVGCWLKRHLDGKICQAYPTVSKTLDDLWKECPKSLKNPGHLKQKNNKLTLTIGKNLIKTHCHKTTGFGIIYP